MRETKITNDTYGADFMFIIAKTRDEVFKEYAIEWNEWGGCCKFHNKIWIIIHPKVPLEVLVHECDHAVSELWKDREIKKLQGVDECYSYMLSWIFDKCYKIWKRKQKK